jgi:DDE superfamily endonuclease
MKERPSGRTPGWSSKTSRQGLRPPKGRTWGRRGRTPVVTVTGGHNSRVSLAALIAVKQGRRPRLVFRARRGTHASKAMRELVAAWPWLTVFQLPAYALELNPVESAWSHLKRSLAKPRQARHRPAHRPGQNRMRRMRYQPGLIEGYLTGTRLDLAPSCNLHS